MINTIEKLAARLHPLAVPAAIALVPHVEALDEMQRRRAIKALEARHVAAFDAAGVDAIVATWQDVRACRYSTGAPHVVTLRRVGLLGFAFEAFDWIADLVRLNTETAEALDAHRAMPPSAAS